MYRRRWLSDFLKLNYFSIHKTTNLFLTRLHDATLQYCGTHDACPPWQCLIPERSWRPDKLWYQMSCFWHHTAGTFISNTSYVSTACVTVWNWHKLTCNPVVIRTDRVECHCWLSSGAAEETNQTPGRGNWMLEHIWTDIHHHWCLFHINIDAAFLVCMFLMKIFRLCVSLNRKLLKKKKFWYARQELKDLCPHAVCMAF